MGIIRTPKFLSAFQIILVTNIICTVCFSTQASSINESFCSERLFKILSINTQLTKNFKDEIELRLERLVFFDGPEMRMNFYGPLYSIGHLLDQWSLYIDNDAERTAIMLRNVFEFVKGSDHLTDDAKEEILKYLLYRYVINKKIYNDPAIYKINIDLQHYVALKERIRFLEDSSDGQEASIGIKAIFDNLDIINLALYRSDKPPVSFFPNWSITGGIPYEQRFMLVDKIRTKSDEQTPFSVIKEVVLTFAERFTQENRSGSKLLSGNAYHDYLLPTINNLVELSTSNHLHFLPSEDPLDIVTAIKIALKTDLSQAKTKPVFVNLLIEKIEKFYSLVRPDIKIDDGSRKRIIDAVVK